MTDDWRAENAKHLRGLRLVWRRWVKPSDNWDHDHCAGCGAKFAEFEALGVQHEGFATGEDCKHGTGYEWVCRQCFTDLRAEMGWSRSEF